MGRGALGVAQRPVPLRSGIAAFGIGCGRQFAEATMRSDGVVVVLPNRQNPSQRHIPDQPATLIAAAISPIAPGRAGCHELRRL
jgi:hypothetical protein